MTQMRMRWAAVGCLSAYTCHQESAGLSPLAAGFLAGDILDLVGDPTAVAPPAQLRCASPLPHSRRPVQQSERRLRVQYGRALSPRLRKCLASRISLERPLSLAVRRVASPALRSRPLAGRLARVVRTRSRPHRMRLAPTGLARCQSAWRDAQSPYLAASPQHSAELAPHCARRQSGGGGGGATANQSGPAKSAPSGAFPPDRKLVPRDCALRAP
jgi:hypothetical protein